MSHQSPNYRGRSTAVVGESVTQALTGVLARSPPAQARIADLWVQANVGALESAFGCELPHHGSELYRLSPARGTGQSLTDQMRQRKERTT